MSMTMLTILQIIWVSAAYLGTVLLLPWFLLRRKLAQFRLPARFIAYFISGNFYCFNLVFLLQLLHISNRATLIAGTVVPFLVVAVIRRERCLELLKRGMSGISSIFVGEMGTKTVALRMRKKMRGYSSGWLGRWVAPRRLDVLLSAGVVLLVAVVYGINMVNAYGYYASDLVTHNYWVNCMEHNQIFADGVYPFGFHCMIYYLHEIFAIPTYVLLRVFTLPQNLMIHLMLLAFLKLVCRSKYAPYAGVVAYLTTRVFYQVTSFSAYTYFRYYSPLPQEYGMVFILPAAYFAVAFLRDKNFASAAKKKGRAEGSAKYSLILFSICISLALATHFYDAAVAGLLCVGIGVGFCFRCLRWQYLKRLVLAGVAGLLIGVLPMAVAYATGTPLQGSLYWGVDSLSGESEAEAIEKVQTRVQPMAAAYATDTPRQGSLYRGINLISGENEAEAIEEVQTGVHTMAAAYATDTPRQGSLRLGVNPVSSENEAEAIEEVRPGVLESFVQSMQDYVTNDSRAAAVFMLVCVGMLLALGVVWLILRKSDYGGVLVSFGVFVGLMCLLQAAPSLGLPSLVYVLRWAIYIRYGLAVVWSLCIDGVVCLLFLERRTIDLAGLAGFAAACILVVLTGVRTPMYLSAYEPNGAIICLTSILRENKDSTSWTICSANDERQMIWERGYHYETIDFLRDQDGLTGDTRLTIPTDTVYFFIEKVPLIYIDTECTVKPEREVSQAGAELSLPTGDGIEPYVGDGRWVTMSHMYYWAQAFQRLYPYEMEVYYEADDFICYRIRQDGYNLYNFAIDYGYNT